MKAKIKFNKPETEEQYLKYMKHWHLGEADIEFPSLFDETYWRNEFASSMLQGIQLTVLDTATEEEICDSCERAAYLCLKIADSMIEEMRKRNK